MKILGCLVFVLALAGCAVHTPDGSIIVDPHPGHGNFCPPGQAKKGNC